MRLRDVMIAAAAVAVSIAAAVAAAPPANAAGDSNDIVVTAVPKDPVELHKRVAGFVGKVAQSAVADQLSRRTSPFCPKVLGLDDKYTPMVLAQIREAGTAARVPELGAGCKTNLLVIFTRNGDALMAALRSQRPGFFIPLEPDKKRELFGSGRAVRWWYENAGRDANGALASNDPSRLNMAASAAELPTTAVYSSSLITTNIVVNLSGNVVVIDVNKAEGFPLDAIAAYAAMVSFAQVSARDQLLGDAPSVLGMFSRAGPRLSAFRQLTVWDLAYLDALSRIPMNRAFTKQRRALTTAMRDSIAGK